LNNTQVKYKYDIDTDDFDIDFDDLTDYINDGFYKYLEDYRKYQIFKGGASAGKSVFIAQKIVINVITKPVYNVLVLRKIGRDNHYSTFVQIKKAIYDFELEGYFKINHSKGQEEIECIVTGNKIIFRGLDDVDKIKSVAYVNGPLICIWIEEADQVLEDDVTQLSIRLRGESLINKHIMLSFNPIDAEHWIKVRFFDNKLPEKDGFVSETTYKDNRFLNKEDRETLENLKTIDQYFYEVYALGKWGNRQGTKVFNNIEIHDFDIPEWDMENLRHGLDFGFNHAQAFIGCGYKDGELYLFRETWAKQTINSEFIKMVEGTDFDKVFPVAADSANPDKITEFNNADFTVYGVKKGPGSLKRGVDFLKSLKKIHIHATKCPNAAREFPRFKYKQIKGGQILDEVVELNDDTIAATRYANEEFFIGGIEADRKPVFTRGIF